MISWICTSLVLGFAPLRPLYQKSSHMTAHDSRGHAARSDYLQILSTRNIPLNMITDRTSYLTNSLPSSILKFTENISKINSHGTFLQKAKRTFLAIAIVPLLLGTSILSANADDELAKFAAAGNSVGVDGKCFLTKCPLETSACANDRTCLKGLSCLAR